MHDLPSHVNLPPNALGFPSDGAVDAALPYGGFLHRYPAMAGLLHARRQELRIGAEDQLFFTEFAPQVRLLVVAEPESVNTAILLPILARLAQMMVRGSLWVAEPELGQAILGRIGAQARAVRTLGSADLPLLIVLDDEGEYQTEWGPHPQALAPYLQAWLDENAAMESSPDEDAYLDLAGACAGLAHRLLHDMRIWYNSGLSAACVAEVRATLAAIGEQADSEADSRIKVALDTGSFDEVDTFGDDDGELYDDDGELYDDDDGDDEGDDGDDDDDDDEGET